MVDSFVARETGSKIAVVDKDSHPGVVLGAQDFRCLVSGGVIADKEFDFIDVLR